MQKLALFSTWCVIISLITVAHAASIFFPGRRAGANGTDPQLVFKDTPNCAQASEFGLCEIENFEYPQDIVIQALANSDHNTVTELTRGDELLEDSLSNRFGGGSQEDLRLIEETPVCTATEAIVYPKMAKTADNDWLFVVNTPGATQAIRVEKCVEEGSPCKVGIEGTTCRQKYIYRKMVAINASKKAVAENFKIPSCCVCYIKNEFLAVRFDGKRRKQPEASSSVTSQSAEADGERAQQDAAAVGGARYPPDADDSRRNKRQAPQDSIVDNEVDGLSGSPLDENAPVDVRPSQGTAQQTIETEQTLNPSDTVGNIPVGRFAGEIIVHSQAIRVEKKKPERNRNRN